MPLRNLFLLSQRFVPCSHPTVFLRKFETRSQLPLCLLSAPEEEGARGAAGGRDPGLREDSHGEEQPPEGPGQDGQSRCALRVPSGPLSAFPLHFGASQALRGGVSRGREKPPSRPPAGVPERLLLLNRLLHLHPAEKEEGSENKTRR